MARPKNPALVSRDAEIYARSKNGQYELATLAKDYKISPQRVGQVIAAKDAQVYAAWKTGHYTLADLADEYGLTPEQVSEIVTVKHPAPVNEEAARSILRARLERFMIAVQEIVENPGWKLAPNGRLACDDDGNPLLDVGAKIEAMKLQLAGMERAARLEGGDKPQRTHVSHEIADRQREEAFAAIVAKREAELRELEEARAAARHPVVPGEVVARELPPSQPEAS